MSDSDFVLNRLIREVSVQSDTADPDELADEVDKRIKPAQRHAALKQALAVAVRVYVSRTRSPIPAASDKREPAAEGSTKSTSPAPRPASASWKVGAIREAWQRALQNRINVGPNEGDWKFLADCTVLDLTHAASTREVLARRNMERASQLRLLADLLTEHDVQVVSQLPDIVLSRTLSDVDAA